MVTMIRGFGRGAIIVSILYLGVLNLPGQTRDFQSWYEVEINKGLKSGIDLSGELEQRFDGNSLRYDRTLLTLSAGYEFFSTLEVAGGARVLTTANREGVIEPRYRIHTDAIGSYPVSVFDLSLRLRMQYGFEDFEGLGAGSDNNLSNRTRFRIRHHIFGTKIDLFSSLETWIRLNGGPDPAFRKYRFSMGSTYNLNFRSELSLRYILEDEVNVANPQQAHIIVLGYAHTL